MTSSVKRAKSVANAVAGSGAASPPRKRVSFHLLKVKELDRITDDAVAITFDVPAALEEEFSYLPGQHVAVRATIAGDDVRRNYSICAPADSKILRIGVKRLVDGVFSNFAIERLRVGDALEVLSPAGPSPRVLSRATASTSVRSRPGRGSPRSCRSSRRR